jgi:hypothetical protein
MAIDLDGMSKEEVRDRFPELYQYLLQAVKPERDSNREPYRRDNWWLFGRKNTLLRNAIQGLPRYIATVETAKHRVFQFLDAEILPDNMLVCVASHEAFHLGVLSSSVHVTWAINAGGTLEDRPRWNKSRCFDPFPFPDTDEVTRQRIANLAEKIDKLRKDQQAAHPGLTLTQMYNVLERIREIEAFNKTPTPNPSPQGGGEPPAPLSAAEEDIRDKGLVLILKEHRDALDAAVVQAYGWPAALSDEDVLERLVALNAERAKQEAQGEVKWLRPEYQIPRFGTPKQKQEAFDYGLPEEVAAVAVAAKAPFPAGEVEQTAAVMAALARAGGPMTAAALAAGFTGKSGKEIQSRIALTLVSLARMGLISREGEGRYSLRRAA